ncbi:MAG: helix-hairpin-helix domain-containing protein [Mariprofundaceae bacterium]|nr:helix-hairpin-helix domain-containing protein [Mariprofundaceae bacterium]
MNLKMIWMAMLALFLMLSGSAYASDKVDLNTASAAQLQELHGIGVKTAAAIVAYREAHGSFKSVDDLTHVKGIGEKKLSKLEGDIEVSSADENENEKKHDD